MSVKRFTSWNSAAHAAKEIRENSPHLRRTAVRPDDSGECFFVCHRGMNEDFVTWLLEDGTMGDKTPVGTVPPPFVGNWQEFQYYVMGPHKRLPENEEQLRKSYEERLINEMFQDFEELREDLLEVVELMKGHMQKADASEDDEQVDRSAWYLLFHVLQIEGDFRGFRTRFKRGVITGVLHFAFYPVTPEPRQP